MERHRRTRLIVGLAVVLGLLFSACGAETETTDAPATTAAAPATTAAAPATTAAAAPETTSAAEPTPTTEAAMEEEVHTLRIAVSGDLPSIDPIFGQNTLTNMTLKNIYAQFLFYEPPEGEGGRVRQGQHLETDRPRSGADRVHGRRSNGDHAYPARGHLPDNR